jgi:hypothetical protein
MRINKLLIIFIIIGILLTAGYIIKSMTTPAIENQGTSDNLPYTTTTWNSIPNSTPGQLYVSIGDYDAQFSVFIDNATYGYVSKDNPVNLELSSGIHTVKICKDTICETTDVIIQPAIITTIDFEKRLNEDISQGSLDVSIGDYPTGLTVYIDNSSAGEVYPGTPLSQTLVSGPHFVQVCNDESCFNQSVFVTSMNVTTADFQDQLMGSTVQTNLEVSVGGYNANIPVLIDNVDMGNVSMGVPLNVKVTEGMHNVTVCSGAVCENSQVETRFGKPTYLDFGAALQRDALNQKPWAKIISSTINGNDVTVNVLLVNPTSTDTTITATISCLYQYENSQMLTQTEAATGQINQEVQAGTNTTVSTDIIMSDGSNPIELSKPVITSVTTS